MGVTRRGRRQRGQTGDARENFKFQSTRHRILMLKFDFVLLKLKSQVIADLPLSSFGGRQKIVASFYLIDSKIESSDGCRWTHVIRVQCIWDFS